MPSAKHGPSAAEEEAAITPEMTRRVGVSVEDLMALMLLDGVRGFGPQKYKALVEAGVAPVDVLEDPSRLPLAGKSGDTLRRALEDITEEQAAQARRRAVRQILRAYENDARILTHSAPEYPRRVYESNNPVPIIYLRGSAAALADPRSVACVGSRHISEPYAALHARFVRDAVRESFVIVSGFATGADRIGHEEAFRAGGRTILVMPCGLDRPFPPENRELWDELLRYEGAAMVSEFHFGTKAAALTLRKRNKLIVAFAQGVLMSQSSASGGAMNAYRFALEQRKPVATFEPDGTDGTTGNAEIQKGPTAGVRGRQPHALFAAAGLRETTAFPLDTAPDTWNQWLRRLSSLT